MANRYNVKYTDPSGVVWDFLVDGWVAGVKSGGFEGMAGAVEDIVASSVTEPGQVVEYQRPVPSEGLLTLHVRGDGKRTAGQVYAALRRAFSLFRAGEVVVDSPAGLVTGFWRRRGPIPDPTDDPGGQDMVLNVAVPLIADNPTWWKATQTGVDSVTVTNQGDVTVRPRIRWSGAGGTVTMPSGASWVLPQASAERVLYLSTARSFAVVDRAGVLDVALRNTVAQRVLPEGVPPGQSRVFKLPPGARLEWEEGVLDPWQ